MAYNPLYRGKTSKAPSRALSTGYQNGTLSGFLTGVPVSTDLSGNITPTDVSSEDSVSKFLGITAEAIPSAASGQVFNGGRAEGLDLSAFSIGDPVYVGVSGTLIKDKPDIGIDGFLATYWIIFIGVVVKNEFDNTKKDIQLMIEIIGQL